MKRLPRSRLLMLMRTVGLTSSMLRGANRSARSSRKFPTMKGKLADPVEYFRKALSIELEHGSINPGTDVTGNDLRDTAKIVAAHIFGVESDERPTKWRLFPAYYDHLMHMEKNGRLF